MNNFDSLGIQNQLETIVSEARGKFDRILSFSLMAQPSAPHKFEKQLFQMLLELGRFLLQIFFISFGNGDEGKEILNDKGENLKRYRLRKIDYISIFGSVEIDRYYYWSRGIDGFCPLDGELNLPERVYSYYLQEIAVRHGVGETYDESLQKIEDTFGIRLSPRSIMDIMLDSSRNADVFRDEQSAPVDDKEVLVVSVDGKGVPMRKEYLSRKKTRLGRGQKNQKKKISSVAAVYTIKKNVRSAGDILEKPVDSEKIISPRPCAKRIRARLGDKFEKENFIKDVKAEADKRVTKSDKLKVFLCDGERFYWNMKNKYFRDYVGVLDLYHVMEKLWNFSHCFKAEGSPEAKDLVAICLRMLLSDNASGCIRFMTTASLKNGLSKARRKTISGIIGYLKRNIENMRYERCLSMGIPIGSGNVEAACKNLVKDRMEGCGMRWCRNGADAILALRAIYLNGDISEYFEYHIERERKRLYGETTGWKRDEVTATSEKRAA